MGIPEQTLRVALQVGAFEFGKAVKLTGQNYSYFFFPEKLKEAIPRKIYDSWGIDYTLEEEQMMRGEYTHEEVQA